MTWNVYVNGDIEMMAGAYNGVAMLFNDSSNLSWAAACFALLALLWAAAKKTMNDKDSAVTNLFLGMVLFTFLVAKDDVVLESSRTGQVITVDNVPLMVAATGGISTSIFSTVIDQMRTAFTAVNPYDISSVTDSSGGLDPLRAIVTASQLSYQGGNLCRPNGSNIDYCAYIKNYSADCIARDISTGGPAQETSFSKLMHSTPAELLTIMKVSVATWTVTRPKTSVSVPDVVTCDVAYQEISAYISGQSFETAMQNFAAAHGISDEAMQSGMNMLMASNLSAFDMNKARFLQTQIVAGLPKGGAVAGPQVAADLSQFQAQEARLAQMGSQYKLYNQLAPAMITAFEFFAIFVAPLVLILSVTGRAGITILVNYLGLVFTLNVWPLASVLVDSFMRYSILRDMNAMNIDMADRAASLSWSSMPDTIDAIQTYLAVGSSLTALAPMMFFALFKVGSGSVMSGGNRQLAPDAPVDTGYVAPTVATAANAGATRAGQITATADLAHQGNQVVSSASGPLAGEMSTGSMTTAALSSAIKSQESEMRSQRAAIGQSVLQNIQAGLQSAKTAGVTDKESAAKAEGLNALLQGIQDNAASKHISTTESAAQFADATTKGEASWLAGLGGGAGIFNLGGKMGGSTSQSDGSKTTDGTENKSGVSKGNSIGTSQGNSASASLQKAIDVAMGTSTTDTSGQSTSGTDLRQQVQEYAQQQSHMKELNQQLAHQTSLGVGAKDDIANLAQRAEGFNLGQTLAGVSGEHKDALVKAGLLSSDGSGLSNAKQSEYEGTMAAVGNASQGTISDQSLERIAGAKTLVSSVQDMFKSGDASQVAAGTAIVNSMIAQGYDSAAMRELSKVGSEIVGAKEGEQANAKWEAAGGSVAPQIQSIGDGVASTKGSLQAEVTRKGSEAGEVVAGGSQKVDQHFKQGQDEVNQTATEQREATAPSAIGQTVARSNLTQTLGEEPPVFGGKAPTKSDAFVAQSSAAAPIAQSTFQVVQESASTAAAATHDTTKPLYQPGIGVMKERLEEGREMQEQNKNNPVVQYGENRPVSPTEQTLMNKQQEMQTKVAAGTATEQDKEVLAGVTESLTTMRNRNDPTAIPAAVVDSVSAEEEKKRQELIESIR